MAGGHFLSFGELGRIVARLTGRRILCPRVPGTVMRLYGRMVDVVDRGFGVTLGPSHEAMVTLTRGVPCDDSIARHELGFVPRPIEETLRDTLSWMFERKLVPDRIVGRIADEVRRVPKSVR
jgi:nucleoside-diphosphate-sugar epimerase